ncbi:MULTISPECIES: hypothetical protein [Campylobacter]|nr:hypothetical protein [Campylobacter sp. IFREMER_LSEM_CL1097]MCR8685967.1 hypothetical protein [Campylobacter sp. 1569]
MTAWKLSFTIALIVLIAEGLASYPKTWLSINVYSAILCFLAL